MLNKSAGKIKYWAKAGFHRQHRKFRCNMTLFRDVGTILPLGSYYILRSPLKVFVRVKSHKDILNVIASFNLKQQFTTQRQADVFLSAKYWTTAYWKSWCHAFAAAMAILNLFAKMQHHMHIYRQVALEGKHFDKKKFEYLWKIKFVNLRRVCGKTPMLRPYTGKLRYITYICYRNFSWVRYLRSRKLNQNVYKSLHKVNNDFWDWK